MEVAFGVNGRFWLDRDRTYHTSCAVMVRVMMNDTEFFDNTATTAVVV
jgi:exosome complex RNA-binding protein Rrp4